MKRNNLLTYYQKHPQAAFAQGFTEKLYDEVVGSDVYEVHKYYLPQKIAKRVKFLKRYSEFLDREVPKGNQKRRHSPCEFAEQAMFVLTRIKMLTEKGYTIVAGSEHVSPVPWAVFGPPGRIMARFYYKNIDDLAGQYHNYMHGKCYPMDFHFRIAPGLAHKLAERHPDDQLMSSPNHWMALGICVAYDIIHNCGPDCNEFFELFTNDYKDNPQTIDFQQWMRTRCKILGIDMPPDLRVYDKYHAKVKFSYSEHSRTEYVKPKPKRMKTEIVEISNDQDLALGESTKPLYIKTLPASGPECQVRTDFVKLTGEDKQDAPMIQRSLVWAEFLPIAHRHGGFNHYSMLPP